MYLEAFKAFYFIYHNKESIRPIRRLGITILPL
jgi:hypothetical protein